MRWPAWIVNALGAATVVLVLAQAHAQPVGAHVVAEDVVLRVQRANLSTGGAEADGSTFGAALSASGRFVAFTSAAHVPRAARLERSDRRLRARPRTAAHIAREHLVRRRGERRAQQEAVDQCGRERRRLPVLGDQPRTGRSERRPGRVRARSRSRAHHAHEHGKRGRG